MTHALVRAAWVGDDLLLIAAEAGAEAGTAGGEAVRIRARAVRSGTDLVLAARTPPELLDDPRARASFDAGEASVEATAEELAGAALDLRGFLREHVAGWDAAARADVIEALTALVAGGPVAPSLAAGLREVRDALRERRALAVVDERVDRSLGVERLHRIADDAFYVAGWVWEPAGPLTALTAVTPEGERVELLGTAFRYPRDDVGERFGAPADRHGGEPAGFLCHFTTSVRSVLPGGWIFEAASASGPGVETEAGLTVGEPDATLAAIVADAGLEPPDADLLRERHVRPALTRLQRLRAERAAVEVDDALGEPPRSARTSVVVPLYERTDLLEHQLAQFSADPAMWECELVYVLDSPEQRDHMRDFAAQLFRLYGMPFRLVTLAAGGGVAHARAAGAARASGELLLFLDSDVLPDRPGWLPHLVALLDAEPGTGALGPKLLHEDDTVQSGGVELERPPGAAEWELRHRFAGLHRTTAAASEPGGVQAVTGACLLTAASAYREAGGFCGDYVQGDYEDADLCMRLAAAGHSIRYAPEVELYHLEGQSYVGGARAANRRYNRWLFNRLWGERIEAAG